MAKLAVAYSLADINAQAIALADGIKLLQPISWPMKTEREFLESWSRGNPKIPSFDYPVSDYSQARQQLQKLLNSFSAHDPMEIFTAKSIQSFILASELVESVKEKRFAELSVEIYGSPGSVLPGSSWTNIQAAERLIDVANRFDHPYMKETELCYPAHTLYHYLKKKIKEELGADGPEVMISEDLNSKATASDSVIRLRNATCFSEYDFEQLFVHEVMTHCLTAKNGKNQKILLTLGRGSPRTTSTQEGLATFSEVITGSIDLSRLKRLALRIVAISKAQQGADFIEIFKYFIENGQNDKESFWSTARIFRGSTGNDGIVFTKDSVYLDGLIHVHTLFRWALINQRMTLLHLLFCGRLTIDDCFLLEESFKSGLIQAPKHIPKWYRQIEGLAGRLSFSVLANMVNLDQIHEYYTQKSQS